MTHKQLREALDVAIEALQFYGDPENYHAITIMGDRPCGEFASDFSKDHGSNDYERQMPGKCARGALKEIERINRT